MRASESQDFHFLEMQLNFNGMSFMILNLKCNDLHKKGCSESMNVVDLVGCVCSLFSFNSLCFILECSSHLAFCKTYESKKRSEKMPYLCFTGISGQF